jgi:hypothetical protein
MVRSHAPNATIATALIISRRHPICRRMCPVRSRTRISPSRVRTATKPQRTARAPAPPSGHPRSVNLRTARRLMTASYTSMIAHLLLAKAPQRLGRGSAPTTASLATRCKGFRAPPQCALPESWAGAEQPQERYETKNERSRGSDGNGTAFSAVAPSERPIFAAHRFNIRDMVCPMSRGYVALAGIGTILRFWLECGRLHQ